MNNIEKNLFDFYQNFYFSSNIQEILIYLNKKYENIVKSGMKDGLILDAENERQLLHRLTIEGISFYIGEKLKNILVMYEESISEQPMLLAHSSGINNEKVLNFIDGINMKNLIEDVYCMINKIYSHM